MILENLHLLGLPVNVNVESRGLATSVVIDHEMAPGTFVESQGHSILGSNLNGIVRPLMHKANKPMGTTCQLADFGALIRRQLITGLRRAGLHLLDNGSRHVLNESTLIDPDRN